MSNTGRHNTFRFPFDINPKVFIVLAVLFFVLSIRQVGEVFLPKVTVKNLGKSISKDIQSKIIKFSRNLRDTSLFERAIHDSLTKDQHDQLMDLPFSFHLYDGESIAFWNSNTLDAIHDSLPERQPVIYKTKNGYFVLYMVHWGAQHSYKAILNIPVKWENPFSSEYMKNYFFVNRQQDDFGIMISLSKVDGAEPVLCNGKPLFYLYRTVADDTRTGNNLWHLLYFALMFIFFGISIHTYFKVMVNRKKPVRIFALLVLTAVGIRALTYFTGFPHNFAGYALFDPSFYTGHFFNKSIGDVFINVCLCFWILLFYTVNVQGRIRSLSGRKKNYPFGAAVLFVIVFLHLFFIDLIYSIILDSSINFDTTLISRFSLFSFFGLISFLVIFANLFLLSFIANNYLNASFHNRVFKYLLLLLVTAIFNYVTPIAHPVNPFLYYIWASTVFFILDFTSSKIRFDFNSIYLIIWIVMVSFFGSYMLTRLNTDKEKFSRRSFAEFIAHGKDSQLEARLVQFKRKIMQDTSLAMLVASPVADRYNEIVNYIYLHFMDEYMGGYKYAAKVFDASGLSVNPADTMSLQMMSVSQFQHVTSMVDSEIYYKRAHEDYSYFVVCPLKIRGKLQGTVVYILYERLAVFDENNTDFILRGGANSQFKESTYSMAIYENEKLVSRKGGYSFASKIDTARVFKKQVVLFKNHEGYNEMWYHFPAEHKTIAIVKKSNKAIMLTTLFAYIFFIYFSTISLYILGNIIARSNLNTKRFFNLLSLNLRLKIQLSILFVVFTSFIAIAYLTTRFLSERIKEKSRVEISDYAQLIQGELSEYFARNLDDSLLLYSGQLNPGVAGSITELAGRFDVNLSLFNVSNGTLIYSSQPELFQSGVLSSRIPHNTFFQLKNNNKEQVINPEAIGDFQYIASYSFIKDSSGMPLAILQMPYIFSNFEISTEINSVIVTIVNIYIFVFLISSILALFISNSVSRPFKFIVKQFTKINLSKTNEPLRWNSSDEIGMLVKEYNRMLRKLENSTVLLAKNERELAWREMAKQVAHEIKNPLTPMKLSLQMLERAIKNNKPNVEEMTTRVTRTIIEQIDNLTIIATNFSNFARLPEVKKEVIVLNEVLHSVTGMYTDSTGFEYLFLIPDYPIHVYADKGQLIRVFTNIIQNAIQAIPGRSKGLISMMVSKIKDNYVRISISDNGCGIPADKAKKLFQPYFTTKSSGTGLGLAMCKDIVEQFDGKIEFESVLNEGTTFHIDLPVISIEEDDHDVAALTM
ncbi:MAG: GHKL domain-containing protein [Chitinophagaceae bacterium]|nr:GHKL domain-containing protein [Chitinophagaceae bacterium]